MNDNSLSSLYRRLTASAPIADAGIEGIVDPASGAAATSMAESARIADLGRLLRALRPHSEALAAAVRDAGAATDVRRGHGHRHAPSRIPRLHAARQRARTARWIGSVAACLVVALVAMHQHDAGVPPTPRDAIGPLASRISTGDRIFASSDRIFAASDGGYSGKQLPGHHDRDVLFRANFSGG